MQPSSITSFVSAFERTGHATPVLLSERDALAIVRTRSDEYFASLADAREAGVHDMFVFEPAGNSFRISETRVLCDRAFALSGADSRAYFFIVRAELLTVDASNSLLKILEDVPAGICFALVSEYPDRILPTVRSRCMDISSVGETAFDTVDPDVVRRIDAYLAGSRSSLLIHISSTVFERADALALLAKTIVRMRATGRVDALLATKIGEAMEDCSGTTISPRNILDRAFLL